MSQQPARPKVPRGVETRWHAGRNAWTFRVRWTDPVSGERRSQEFDTADDAVDYQAYLRLARRRGALDELSRGRIVLSEFVEDDWWPNHAGRQLSRHTLTAYSQVWNRNLLPRVGHLELRQVTTPTVQTLREALEADGTGPATVRKSLAVLQSICAHAVRKGELTINPVSAVRKPAAKRAAVIDAFSVEQVEALIGALRHRASHPSQWMLAELIAYSGARPQDALALTYARIGTQRIVYAEKNIDGRIVSGSKTGADRARSVTLLTSLRKDLLAFRLAAGNPPDDALVLPQADGKPWRLHDYKNWQRNAVKTERSSRPASIFAAAATAMGRPDATPYFLRHTYASLRLAEQRLSLQEIAEEMGHTVEVLARTYAHVISEYRGQGPIDPEALIKRARRSREAPQKRPKAHHQQLELLKPTGGLEPPTPSLRAFPVTLQAQRIQCSSAFLAAIRAPSRLARHLTGRRTDASNSALAGRRRAVRPRR
jgi:integrase